MSTWPWLRSGVPVGLLFAAPFACALAQNVAEPAHLGPIAITGSVRARVEGWDWFKGQGENGYAYSGTLARISLSQSKPRFDWQLELAAPILLGLPNGAIGPGAQGQFGLGAAYFAANNPAGAMANRNSAFVFPMQAFVRFKSPFGRTKESLRIGRFQFADGAEVVPANPTLATLKASRVNQRLIGTFAFTHVQRAFYGGEYRREIGNLTLNAVAALPTRGVFQVDGWGVMKTAFAYGSVTGSVNRPRASSEWRLFGIYYDDWRRVTKTDNRPPALRAADAGAIKIGTFGAHVLHTATNTAGTVDLIAWAAIQGGRWGALTHRAAAFDVEAGLQPKLLPRVRPWIRAGFTYASGDGDAADARHGTFFQLLPTPRLFALFPFYNMMNTEDAFGIFILRPSSKLTVKQESHWLRLASGRDLWYAGGGAFQPWTFGFSGRPTNGAVALANVYDVSADYVLNKNTTASAYWGHAAGKSVVAGIFKDRPSGSFGYLEMTFRF